jgi:hypothetical protein
LASPTFTRQSTKSLSIAPPPALGCFTVFRSRIGHRAYFSALAPSRRARFHARRTRRCNLNGQRVFLVKRIITQCGRRVFERLRQSPAAARRRWGLEWATSARWRQPCSTQLPCDSRLEVDAARTAGESAAGPRASDTTIARRHGACGAHESGTASSARAFTPKNAPSSRPKTLLVCAVRERLSAPHVHASESCTPHLCAKGAFKTLGEIFFIF